MAAENDYQIYNNVTYDVGTNLIGTVSRKHDKDVNDKCGDMSVNFPVAYIDRLPAISENIPFSAGTSDYRGYKGEYPDPKWPGGANIAVNFVLNYEEGGEYNVLNGDMRSEAYMQELMGSVFRVGARDIQMESQYEYGTRAGVWRIAKLFKEKDIKCTVYAVGMSILKSPEAAKNLVKEGHEFASHGYKWIDHHSLPLVVEKQQIEKGLAAIREITNKSPVGWYIGRPSTSSKGLICKVHEEQGAELLYQSDSYADDIPYWTRHPLHKDKGLLILPYCFDSNDVKYTTSPGAYNPHDWLQYVKMTFDQLYKEGVEGQPKMMSIGLHSRISGRPARTMALRELIDYIQSHENVWIATREEIARHWIKHYPYNEKVLNDPVLVS